VSTGEERERMRAWVERQRARYARCVAWDERIERAERALRASSEHEREERIVALVKAQIEADLCGLYCARDGHRRCPSGSARLKSSQTKTANRENYDDRRGIGFDDEFDGRAWDRAIELALIEQGEARAIVERVDWRSARDGWSSEPAHDGSSIEQARDGATWDADDAERNRTLLLWSGSDVLRVLPSMRASGRIDDAVRAIDAAERWDTETSSLASWAIAMLRGDSRSLQAADTALHELGSAWLCAPDEEDGRQFDRRVLLVERLLEAGELEMALRWVARLWTEPVRFAVGRNNVGEGPPIALSRKLQRALSPERFDAFEQRAYELLSDGDPSTFVWLDFAQWASAGRAAHAVERAVQLVETTGALIDANRLDRAMQRRVSIAMARWFGVWIETVDCVSADDQVRGRTTLSARLRGIPLVDRECAERAWPALKELVKRARNGTHFNDKFAIADAVATCAMRGVAEARALVDRWRATGEHGWGETAPPRDGWLAPESLSWLVMGVPFDERVALIERFEREAGLVFDDRVATRGLPMTAEGLRWLLSQPGSVINRWLNESSPAEVLDAEAYWKLLDASATRGIAATQNSVFAMNGDHRELSEWLQRERNWEGSRWSWTREQLLAWIASGEPRTDRHWVFEPGARAIVLRLRGDAAGREALASLAAQIVERIASDDSDSTHERGAVLQLIDFASEATFLEYVRLLERARGWSAPDAVLRAARFGAAFVSEVQRRLDVSDSQLEYARAFRADRLEGVSQRTFDDRWSAWIESPTNSPRAPWWLVQCVSASSQRELIEWALGVATEVAR
jgi:hypothetical protein